ncbi:MAG: hypothetical protein ACTSPW_09695 [Promethearchaeota archaeon]
MMRIEEYREIILGIIQNSMHKILSLIDRNKNSPTFGCFDREFWHYRSKIFLNGMQQCYILSLAYLYSQKFKKNFLYKNSNLKELIIGCLNFTFKNLHKDGSLDEHYFNEHSIAATSFVLYSITETILLLNMNDSFYLKHLAKMARFLLKNKEKFIRSNHIACNILVFYNLYLIFKNVKYKHYSDAFLKILYKHRSEEGWFKEYNGCDPGYLTLTMSFLTKYAIKSRNIKVLKDIEESIKFCSHFMHPDGTFGGFYGSRENNHFFVFSFEKVKMPDNLGQKMVNLYLKALKDGNAEIISDDRFSFLQFNDLFELYKIFNVKRVSDLFLPPKKKVFFRDSGLFIYKDQKYYIIISLKKGGVIYIFKGNYLLFRNCGLLGKIKNKLIMSTGYKNVKYHINKEKIKIEGKFKIYSNNPKVFFPPIFMNFFNFFLGYVGVFRRLLKRKLIKLLVLKEKEIDIKYLIEFSISENIEINISIINEKKYNLEWLKISSYAPTLYIPSAKFFTIHDFYIEDIFFDKRDIIKLNNSGSVKFTLKFK